jgi:hypothetical protein
MEHLERQIRAFHHTPWQHRKLRRFLRATGITMLSYVEVNAAIERQKFDRLQHDFWYADDHIRRQITRRILKRIDPEEERIIHDPRKNDYAWAIWINRSKNGKNFVMHTTKHKRRRVDVGSQEATRLLASLLEELLPHPLDDLAVGE